MEKVNDESLENDERKKVFERSSRMDVNFV